VSGSFRITATDECGVTYDPSAGGIVINHLVVKDLAVLAEAAHWGTGLRGPVERLSSLQGVDLTEFALQAFAAGSVAIRAASGAQEAHHLDSLIAEVGKRTTDASDAAAKATSAATTRATEELVKAADAAQRAMREVAENTRDTVIAQVTVSKQQLTDEIGRLVGGDDPVLTAKLDNLLGEFGTKLDERVHARTDDLIVRATRQLDPRDPTSPMAAVTKQLQDQHSTLVEQLSKGQGEVSERLEQLNLSIQVATAASNASKQTAKVTPLKGTVFADAVHQRLSEIALGQGDEYVDTSSEVGHLPRCKKGDGMLVTTTPAGAAQMVFEMSDSGAPRSWNDYLDEAERNRGAVVSLGLVRFPEQIGGERVRCLGPRRFVMAYDPDTDDMGLLRAVVFILRGQAVIALGHGAGEDLHTAEAKLAEATKCVEHLADVQKTAGSIRRDADKIDSTCASIRTAVGRLLAEAAASLSTAFLETEAA